MTKRLFEHSDCTYANVVGATTTVVTAGANLNGIYIRYYNGYATGGGGVFLSQGGNLIHTVGSGAGNANSEVIEDIFIPAGVALQIQASASCNGTIYYRIL